MPRNTPQESYTCLAPAEDGRRGACGRPSVGESLCGTHLRRKQRNGTLERKRRPRTRTGAASRGQGKKLPCKHPEGCPNPSWAKGWCSMHYSRVYNSPTGDPGPVGKVRKFRVPGTCKHPDGCPRPGERTDGWCFMHGWRVDNKDGDPGPAQPIVRRRSRHTETQTTSAVQGAVDTPAKEASHAARSA